jgi:tetratricopeptide (TPR) repeat protein
MASDILRNQLRIIRDHLRLALSDPLGTSRRWVEHAFRDFTFPDGRREALISAIAVHERRIATAYAEAQADGAKAGALAQILTGFCSWIADSGLWHKELKFRSYVDISIAVRALRLLAEHVSPLDPQSLTSLMLEHAPDSRPALLVHADLLLEEGDVDGAIASIQHALRVQAVCITAQEALFRAYRAKRSLGSEAEELKVLDYDLSDKFCHLPFTHLSTGYQGSAHACCCPAWLPFPIGNVLEAESADAVWNSEAAQEIRRSVLDGDFSYCSRTLCSYISAEKLPTKGEITDPLLRGYIDNHVTVAEVPAMVELNYDSTCNLACPSCRTEIVVAKADEQDLYARATDRVLLPLLKQVNGLAYLSGGGEAFASKHYRALLSALNREEYPGLKLFLISNALLITPHRWREFPHLPEMIGLLSISIDAARAETYEQLRRPGKWSVLMRNMEFIAEMRRAGTIKALGINFVVQQSNYREMLEFVELGDRLSADQIWFQRVTNYGAYDQTTFASIDVTSPLHPEHEALLEILRHPSLKRPNINMVMLLSLLPEALGTEERVEFLYTATSSAAANLVE